MKQVTNFIVMAKRGTHFLSYWRTFIGASFGGWYAEEISDVPLKAIGGAGLGFVAPFILSASHIIVPVCVPLVAIGVASKEVHKWHDSQS
jgi:hypothetical protein